MVPVNECDANVNKNVDDDMDKETGFNEEDNTATSIQITQEKLPSKKLKFQILATGQILTKMSLFLWRV